MSRVDVYLKLGALLLFGSTVAPGQSGATVGVWELRHPAPPKVSEVVIKAFHEAASGATGGITTLRRSLSDPEIAPYALKAIGALHLDSGQVQASVAELREAVHLLPWDPQAQGFLSYALFVAGDNRAAEEEARRSLRINRREPAANLTMALVTVDRIVDNGGTVFDIIASDVPARLRAAAVSYPGTWLILWSYYSDSGQSSAAERALMTYRQLAALLTPDVRDRNERWLSQRTVRPAVHSVP